MTKPWQSKEDFNGVIEFVGFACNNGNTKERTLKNKNKKIKRKEKSSHTEGNSIG
jgi:hypothetical protein